MTVLSNEDRICRAQEVIENDKHNLLCIQTELTDILAYMQDAPQQWRDYYHIVHDAREYIRSGVFSSMILDMCRSAPISPSEVQEERHRAWGKEISTCERSERPLTFRYDCWFDPHHHANTPLVAGVPANPTAAWKIHLAFPDDITELTRTPPLRLLVRMHFSVGAVLPKVYYEGDDRAKKDYQFVAGEQWRSPSDRHLTYMEKLGYLQKEVVDEVLFGLDAYNRFFDVYENRRPIVYEYTCLVDVPEIFYSMPH